MIYPHEVIVLPFELDSEQLRELEIKIDSTLRDTWIAGTERRIHISDESWSRNCPYVEELVKRYTKAGWRCESYGYASILFHAPKPKSETSWSLFRFITG
jgi:hypothetical protein